MGDLIDLNNVEKDDFQKIVSMERERLTNVNYNNERNAVTGILEVMFQSKVSAFLL